MDSEDHVLLPDSTFGESARYDNTSRAGLTPAVSAEDAAYGLHPFDQRLDVRSTAADSLRFFGEPVDLEGGLSLKGDRMTARGTFHLTGRSCLHATLRWSTAACAHLKARSSCMAWTKTSWRQNVPCPLSWILRQTGRFHLA